MPPGQLGYLVWSAAAAARDLDPVAPSPFIHGSYKWYLSGPRVLWFGIRTTLQAVCGRPLALDGDSSCLRYQG